MRSSSCCRRSTPGCGWRHCARRPRRPAPAPPPSASPGRGALARGFAGPALLLGEFAGRYGLGWDAPWYLTELRVVGYVPFIAAPLLVIWLPGAPTSPRPPARGHA